MNTPILNTSLQIKDFLLMCGLDAPKAKTLVESVDEGLLSDALEVIVHYLLDTYTDAASDERSEGYDEGYSDGYSAGYSDGERED